MLRLPPGSGAKRAPRGLGGDGPHGLCRTCSTTMSDTLPAAPAPAVSAELLARYDRPGPRYTSYPTAVEFHAGFTAADYAARLGRVPAGEPVSLYLHLPFCAQRCAFCACNVVSTRRRDVAARYLDYLKRELELLAATLPPRLPVVQFHLGGGTPTYFEPGQLEDLCRHAWARFPPVAAAELAVEVDPRVTTHEHIDCLRSLGFNRLSMGVQDFAPAVQAAIGRYQQEAATRTLFAYCRAAGIPSINIDLVYGLPRQDPGSFGRTLDAVLALRPERVAVYSFAYVPWAKAHQKRLDAAWLPRGTAKLALFAQAISAFCGAGYEQIGMDHFALPDDELCRARAEHRLHRNFMGYTVHRAATMIGAGITGIGDVAGAYVQNRRKLSTYYRDLDSGDLPVERGIALSADDQVRRHVITEIMCNGMLGFAAVEARFGIRFREYFAPELAELAGEPAADGLLEMTADGLRATALGRLFIRNLCMPFDRYLRRQRGEGPAFSRTV